ncbi:MAG: TrkH family potassium uptake protein [Kiritimatiellae bacterium]|nr:TrkH family potassium uptake protein [Kiritimatiellia bacterium]
MVLSLLRIFSYVLALAGVSLLLPLLTAVRYGETRATWAFAVPMAASIAVAAAITVVYRHLKAAPLSIRAAFVAVGGSWILLGFFGSLPLWLSGAIDGFTNCLFESISGFTTTGATVIFDVESLPHSINLWRCEMHWLGGMGVIALVVALVPLLGIGGMRLIRAETTGPEKGKLTARITNTAKVLWFIYVGFTVAQFVLLLICDMGYFDALCLSFSTLGTGGFSSRNLSVGAFDNPAVEWVTFAFMILGSINFALYYRFFTGRVGGIWRDSELRAFMGIVFTAIICVTLIELPGMKPFGETLRDSAFHVASIISSTGFMTDDYTAWRSAAQIVLLSLVVIGGCSGSTAGGIKVVRWTVLFKQLVNEFRKLVHPHGVFTLRLNAQPGREMIVPYVASFIFAYLLLVFLTMFFGALAGLAPFEALTGSLSMVGNIGPAFGELGPTAHYGDIPGLLKLWYCIAMLAGRLEIFTLFILIGTVFGFRRKNVRAGRFD